MVILKSGRAQITVLGSAVERGECPQFLVSPMTWQALRIKKGGRWALFSTTVSPGFEFEDFELGKREALAREYPAAESLINELTRA